MREARTDNAASVAGFELGPGRGSGAVPRAASESSEGSRAASGDSATESAPPRLPPGQYAATGWPVVHYGPVPGLKPETWRLRVFGATASGREHSWTLPEFVELPTIAVTGDLHCVTKFSVADNLWEGVPTEAVLRIAPPATGVTHVMVWAEYGFSANIRYSDFAAGTTLLATHRGGEQLSPEHGFPVRLVVPHLYAWKSVKWLRAIEYLTADRRGFWEDRGYHNVADPWTERRYAHQEEPGDGPPF